MIDANETCLSAMFTKFQFAVSIRSDPYAMIRQGSLLNLFQRNFRIPEEDVMATNLPVEVIKKQDWLEPIADRLQPTIAGRARTRRCDRT